MQTYTFLDVVPKLVALHILSPLNPPQGDFRTNQGLKSPPAGRRNGVPVGVNLGGEMRLLQFFSLTAIGFRGL